jgi:outer membrane protein OmpA-like peptidoglycan-associated protein
LQASEKGGNKLSQESSIILPVRQITPEEKSKQGISDKKIEVYDLILFDFDSDEIGEGNERVIEEIKSTLSSTSSVTIIGQTDNTGSSAYNQQLAQRRAESVRKLFPATVSVRVVAKGVTNELPNSSSEARHYNRNVRIIVESRVIR